MNIGENATAEVRAREFWNGTGIQLAAGQTYLITAEGRWVDFYIPHGPDGDPSPNAYMRLFEDKRPLPHEDWFTLIGTLDHDPTTAFRIGSRCNYRAEKSGELTCFANDVKFRCFYWNNRSQVTPISRVKRLNSFNSDSFHRK